MVAYLRFIFFFSFLFGSCFVTSAGGRLFKDRAISKDTVVLGEKYNEDSDMKIISYIKKACEIVDSDPNKAIYYANTAVTEATAIKNDLLKAQALEILGDAYLNIGDFVTSFDVLTEAINICPPEARSTLGRVYINISFAYTRIKDFDNAFLYVQKAKLLFEDLKDTISMARCSNSTGLIYIQIPDYKMAEKYFYESLRLNRSIKNAIGIAQNLNNLSFTEGDAKLKISQLEEAIAINDSLGRTWVLGENYNNLGMMYCKIHEYEKALSSLDMAKKYAEITNGRDLIMDNFRYKSSVYSSMKDYANAYRCTESLLEMIESNDVSGGMKKIEVELMKKNLKNSEKEKYLKEQEYKVTRSIWLFSIIVLIVICIITYISFVILRNNNKRKILMLETRKKLDQQEKELIKKALDYNKNELSNFAFYVKSRTDILENIQSELKKAYSLPYQELVPYLRKMSLNIAQLNSRNDEANKMVDKLDADFLLKLSEIHPNLTKTEKRLASLLKIGLSSKEISLILSMEPKSVDMARYRLRKALNLSSDSNLCDYISSI